MFSGMTFCLSGNFHEDEAQHTARKAEVIETITSRGGRIVNVLTDTTTYAMFGTAPAKRHVAALEKFTATIKLTDEHLRALCNPVLPRVKRKHDEIHAAAAPEQPSVVVPSIQPLAIQEEPPPPQLKTRPTYGGNEFDDFITSPPHSPPLPEGNILLTEKWAPKRLHDIVGNAEIVRELQTWLSTWTTGAMRAVLLCGSAGVGKTTMAHLIAETCGYEVLELNASDVRNKSSVNEILKSSASSFSVLTHGRCNCIIMDEVDGMSSGDQGGAAALIDIIATTKAPIICICNDKYAPSVKTLKAHCRVFDVQRPSVSECMARARLIAKSEKMGLSDDVLRKIVTECNGDMRHTIITMQLSATTPGLADTCGTNQTVSPFEGVRTIFGTSSLAEREAAYWANNDMMGLFVAENYSSTKRAKHLPTLSSAADAISDGDVMDAAIHARQHYVLEPVHAILSAVLPAALCNGGMWGKISFPSILGQISSGNKHLREARMLSQKLRVPREEIGMAVRLMLAPLTVTDTKDKAQAELAKNNLEGVLETLVQCHLTRADVDTLGDFVMEKDFMKKIPAPIKAAITKHLKKAEADYEMD